jgi:hypothetical protein
MMGHILVEKDVYERYLLSSDLANLKYKKIRNRNVHYGCIVPYSFFEWYQYDSAWAIELLILVQGNARARRWDKREVENSHVFCAIIRYA